MVFSSSLAKVKGYIFGNLRKKSKRKRKIDVILEGISNSKIERKQKKRGNECQEWECGTQNLREKAEVTWVAIYVIIQIIRESRRTGNDRGRPFGLCWIGI